MKTHLRRFVTLFFVTMIFCASSCLRSRSEEAAGNITAESNPGDHKESSNINGQASKSSVTTLHTPIGFFEDNAVTLMENVNIGVLRTGRRSKHILANDIQIDKDILRLAAVKMVQLFCTIESQKKPATAAEEAHLVNYLKALAERYDGDGIDDDPSGVVINYYQVGNELDFVDSAWKGTWLEYTQTVRLMHDAILSENPNAKICLFGLLGTEKSVKDFKDVVLKKFKDEMIQSGKPQPFHIIDIHNYFLQGASTVALKYEEVVTYASQIKTKLDEFGMTAEFCITESGTWSGEAVLLSGAPGTHHTEQQHAIDIIKRLVYPVAHGFSFTLWTQMLENSDFSGWQIFTKVGLIHNGKNTNLHLNDDNKDGIPDNWKKLGYYSYKLLSEKIASTNSSNFSIIEEGNFDLSQPTSPDPGQSGQIKIISIQPGTGAQSWLVWRDTTDNTPAEAIKVNLPVDDSIFLVRITEAIPDKQWGYEIDENNYLYYFRSYEVMATDGIVELRLAERPLYVEVVIME